MTLLAGLEETKRALRFDGSDQDDMIEDALTAASSAVLTYIKDWDAFQDSNGEIDVDSDGNPLDVPGDVKRATILLAGIFIRDPSGVQVGDWEQGMLPMPVRALLIPFRDPTVA